MTENITLPREVVKFVLQHLEWWSDDEPQEKEAIAALRTALAAEQPKPSEDVEALRRDAERYRWLRERAWFQFEFEGRYGDSGETLQELDAAIDAAMKEGT